jgi:hypothetical protein
MPIKVAGVNAGTAAAGMDCPVVNGMTPNSKIDGGNGTVQGILAAAQANVCYYTGILPHDFVSFGIARTTFTTSDTTSGHTIFFDMATACANPISSPGTVVDTPAFNTPNNFTTVTLGGGAVSNGLYSTSTGSLTGTGCAADYAFHLRMTRTHNGTNDTSSDTAIALTGFVYIEYNGSYQ